MLYIVPEMSISHGQSYEEVSGVNGKGRSFHLGVVVIKKDDGKLIKGSVKVMEDGGRMRLRNGEIGRLVGWPRA